MSQYAILGTAALKFTRRHKLFKARPVDPQEPGGAIGQDPMAGAKVVVTTGTQSLDQRLTAMVAEAEVKAIVTKVHLRSGHPHPFLESAALLPQ